jgi:hypothetical protein
MKELEVFDEEIEINAYCDVLPSSDKSVHLAVV